MSVGSSALLHIESADLDRLVTVGFFLDVLEPAVWGLLELLSPSTDYCCLRFLPVLLFLLGLGVAKNESGH